MRLVATSDTHKPVTQGKIPDGDVFVFAGDLCNTGYIDDFYLNLEWLSQLPHKHKFLVGGNHDFHLINYPGPALQELRSIGFTVLGFPGNENYYTAKLPNGMTIGGFPLVNGLQERWAFGLKHFRDFGVDEPYTSMLYNLIRSCEILVTHAPIYGILDQSTRSGVPVSVGDENMLKIIQECSASAFKVQHVIHGHIHEARGSLTDLDIGNKSVSVHNVAMCDRRGNHNGKPLVLDL